MRTVYVVSYDKYTGKRIIARAKGTRAAVRHYEYEFKHPSTRQYPASVWIQRVSERVVYIGRVTYGKH